MAIKPRPESLDERRIVKDVPPGHLMWLGEGRLWARLILFERLKGIELDSSFVVKVLPTCKVRTCIDPQHQRLYAKALPEHLAVQGITVSQINSPSSNVQDKM